MRRSDLLRSDATYMVGCLRKSLQIKLLTCKNIFQMIYKLFTCSVSSLWFRFHSIHFGYHLFSTFNLTSFCWHVWAPSVGHHYKPTIGCYEVSFRTIRLFFLSKPNPPGKEYEVSVGLLIAATSNWRQPPHSISQFRHSNKWTHIYFSL